MKYLIYAFAWLSYMIIATEQITNVAKIDQSKETIIEVYLVNKMSRDFSGKYIFYRATKCLSLEHSDGGKINIKPGHKQTIQRLSFGGLNKFTLEAASDTNYILPHNKNAFCIEDRAGAMVPVDQINHMHVDEATQYPETPQSWCVIL